MTAKRLSPWPAASSPLRWSYLVLVSHLPMLPGFQTILMVVGPRHGSQPGINTDYIVWASKTEPIGRYLYELGRTPRKSMGYYQRMYSAASKLGAGWWTGKPHYEIASCSILPV